MGKSGYLLYENQASSAWFAYVDSWRMYQPFMQEAINKIEILMEKKCQKRYMRPLRNEWETKYLRDMIEDWDKLSSRNHIRWNRTSSMQICYMRTK